MWPSNLGQRGKVKACLKACISNPLTLLQSQLDQSIFSMAGLVGFCSNVVAIIDLKWAKEGQPINLTQGHGSSTLNEPLREPKLVF